METIVISGKTYDETALINEKEEYIRLEAVDMCFALSALVYDKSSLIRTAVARKKVGHDLLVNDDSWRVRATVAKYTDNTEILDKLINDEKDFVRFIIVKRGYALEFFINDEDEEIASIAKHQIQQREVA
ncbi:MAG: hypothetical protein L3J59_13775 [Methylococcaceae bacterium]|nr:hypothetical protein [Methylococcaceae bacterium]